MNSCWRTRMCRTLAIVLAAAVYGPALADQPVTLETVTPPEANRPDEPLAAEFSAAAAARFLDSASLDWQKSRGCMTCHTNFAYLMARPAIAADAPAHLEVRNYADKLVNERWEDKEKGPRWDAEVVMAAAALAYNDAVTTGKLHPTTRKALDRMWTVQREDGGWNWLKCDWPPMESDDYFGATMAAIAAGVAPEGYAETPAAKAGLEKLRGYVAKNPPPTLHHRAMLLWGSKFVPNLVATTDRQATIDDLLKLQKADGGWALPTLGDWAREDKSPQDMDSSDGYGTGFVIFVLRQADVPAADERLTKGVQWLKTHQRASGRWFTRSLHKDNKHFITHAGSSFAVMALSACNALTTAATPAPTPTP